MSREGKHRFLKKLGSFLLLLFSAVAIYLFVCFYNPQDPAEEPLPQELHGASPAVVLSSEDELPRVISDFPVPVLCSWGDVSLKLIAGSSYDTAFENGFGRVLALRYLYGTTEVDVYSIYPARAVSILGRADYHMSVAPSPLLAGWSSVRMPRTAPETYLAARLADKIGLQDVAVDGFGQRPGNLNDILALFGDSLRQSEHTGNLAYDAQHLLVKIVVVVDDAKMRMTRPRLDDFLIQFAGYAQSLCVGFLIACGVGGCGVVLLSTIGG